MDTNFRSDFYMRKALSFMQTTFQSLSKDDYFGYICIGPENSMPISELILEKKADNLGAKKTFLNEINDPEFMTSVTYKGFNEQAKLNEAIIKAIK